jgi:hypothetical protein
MNVDVLSGRALDAEVARRVFRVTVEEHTTPGPGRRISSTRCIRANGSA